MDDETTEVAAVEEAMEDHSATAIYKHYTPVERDTVDKTSKLKMPTLAELLASKFRDRQYLLRPWLREQESCMLYADTGVGKSMFALSVALAVAGGGEFLGWKPDQRASGGRWRVLYVDGEMHIADVQDRAAMLLDAVPGIDRDAACENLRFLARQHQAPDAVFPSITEQAGTEFYLRRVEKGRLDLVILDNFSTLGEVEDENAASSFNAIQQFLLQLKVQGVATILVHHAKKGSNDPKRKSEDRTNNFRGSSKLAATFETIIELERTRTKAAYEAAGFRVRWEKVRMGGPKRTVRAVVARLAHERPKEFGQKEQAVWEYEDGALALMDDLKERFINGEFKNQKEISDLYGKSPPVARTYIDKGVKLGMWTEDEVDHWFALGNHLRKAGKTEAPVKPDRSWRTDVPDGGEDGAIPF